MLVKLRSSSVHILERPQKGSHNRQVPALPLFLPPGTLSSPSVIQIKPPPCPGKAFWCYKQEGLTDHLSILTTHTPQPPSLPGFPLSDPDQDAASHACAAEPGFPVSLPQPTRSCPLPGAGLEQMFHPGTQTWPYKTESTPRSPQVRRFMEAGYPFAQLWGL